MRLRRVASSHAAATVAARPFVASRPPPNRAVREHDAHPLAARRPGEVVQQAQAAVVGVVHVVDGEQQALTRRGQPD